MGMVVNVSKKFGKFFTVYETISGAIELFWVHSDCAHLKFIMRSVWWVEPVVMNGKVRETHFCLLIAAADRSKHMHLLESMSFCVAMSESERCKENRATFPSGWCVQEAVGALSTDSIECLLSGSLT